MTTTNSERARIEYGGNCGTYTIRDIRTLLVDVTVEPGNPQFRSVRVGYVRRRGKETLVANWGRLHWTVVASGSQVDLLVREQERQQAEPVRACATEQVAPKEQPTVSVLAARVQVGTRVLLDGLVQVVTQQAVRDGDVYTMRFSPRGEYAFGARSDLRLDVIVEPGTPATFFIGSDRYARRVTRVGKVRADGQIMDVDVDGATFTWREKFGRFARKGDPGNRGGGGIALGYGDEYMDPSF